jgi:tetratricopeptide (TPR) repeat protein
LADKHFAYARAAQTNLDTKEIINQFQLAHNIYPYEEYYYRFSVSEFSKYLPKEEAIEHIKKAILLNPVSSSYYDSLGSLYTELNRDKEAEIAFKKAYKLNPNNIEALINLGFLYYKSGKNEEAIRIYSKGLSLAPYTESEGATLVANLLESYQNKGEIKKAIMLTEDILSKEEISLIKERSSWDKVRHILAKLYFKEGNYTKSYRIMEKLVKLYPENMQYFCDLGSAYYKAGDFKKAKLTFQYVVRKDPANSYAQKVLATLK